MKKVISININSELYNKFKDYCNKNGMVISKKIELLIENELNKIK